MLIGEATKYGTGIILFGDYVDLINLHETIHTLSGDDESIETDYFLSFAYDIRKAYDGQREKKILGSGQEISTYYGFKTFWIDFIVILNRLRERAGYISTSKGIQSNLYRLEAIAESTIRDYVPEIADDILKYIFIYKISYIKYLEPLMAHIVQNCVNALPGKNRLLKLKKELILLNLGSFEHIEFKKMIEQEAKKLGCDIEKLNYELKIDDNFEW
jgi:hypothetical protein